jgi:hypothetical protein
MRGSSKSIVVSTTVLVLVVLLVGGFYILEIKPKTDNTSESLPIEPETTSIENQIRASTSGRCTPAIMIETTQFPDQRVGDLYQECLAQPSEKACQQVDRFHYDKNAWGPDGKADCRWQETMKTLQN